MATRRGFSDDLGNVEGKFAHARASKLAHDPVLMRLRNAVGVSVRDAIAIAIAIAVHMWQSPCAGGGACGGVMAAVGEGSGDRQAHGPGSGRELKRGVWSDVWEQDGELEEESKRIESWWPCTPAQASRGGTDGSIFVFVRSCLDRRRHTDQPSVGNTR